MATSLPKLSHVLETCLYVRSAPKSAAFYQKIFGVKPHLVNVSRSTDPVYRAW
jgi:catechol 2,3-dioxygenase-like lactoylglutathione lyase family enzyme